MTEEAIEADEGDSHKFPLLAAFGALGIVYGDIGTSPLYALKQAVVAAEAGGGSADVAVIGAVACALGACPHRRHQIRDPSPSC
jgi:KUP system potassium uptake protein